MPNNPPKLRASSFASFENVPGAGGRRRKATWSLRPTHDPSASEATDAARRLVTEAELMQGLGRKQVKE